MLRTLVAVPAIVADTALLAGPVIGASWISDRAADALIRAWARGVLRACGATLTVRKGASLDLSRRYVFVANHQSHLDAPSIVCALPTTLRFVAKRSLLRIPVFGQVLRAVGTIDIDRGDRADTIRRMEAARTGIAQRASILFFAEGTRSQDGTLGPFKKGAVSMAAALRLPLVPIAVSGTREILHPGLSAIRPGPVRVSIGEPIDVEDPSPEGRAALTERLHAEVSRLLARE